MSAAALLRTALKNFAGLLNRGPQGKAFAPAMHGWLLDVKMFAGGEGRFGQGQMQMVGHGQQHGIHIVLRLCFLMLDSLFHFAQCLRGALAMHIVDIAEGAQLDTLIGGKCLGDFGPAAARANQRQTDSFVRALHPRVRSGADPGGYKFPAIHGWLPLNTSRRRRATIISSPGCNIQTPTTMASSAPVTPCEF